MSIRLLALDIDGTLTNSIHEVGQVNLDAIERARKADVFVTVATGRGYFSSRNILKALHIEGPVIHYGGAWVLDTPSGETLQLSPLDPDIVHDVLLLAHELHTAAQLYEDDKVIVEEPNPFTERYVRSFGLPLVIEPHAIDMTFANTPKMLLLTSDEREQEIISAFTERLAGRVGVARSRGGFIEINCAGVSKASGLSFLSTRLGIARDEIAAIGDSHLDMDMIRWAGTGVCVANGVDEVKNCADIVVPSCDDNGVAYFIDHYIL